MPATCAFCAIISGQQEAVTVLETERLILRPPRPEDFEPYAAYMADDASRFIGGPQARSQAWRGFMSIAGAWAMSGYSMFSAVEKDSGRWIGRIGPWAPADWPGTEVGWGVSRECWGRGYATEGAAAAIDWAFDHYLSIAHPSFAIRA